MISLIRVWLLDRSRLRFVTRARSSQALRALNVFAISTEKMSCTRCSVDTSAANWLRSVLCCRGRDETYDDVNVLISGPRVCAGVEESSRRDWDCWRADIDRNCDSSCLSSSDVAVVLCVYRGAWNFEEAL